MNAKLLGLFSGFPMHHFSDEIALVLRENLLRRENLFLSAPGLQITYRMTMTVTGCMRCLRNAVWRSPNVV